MGVFVLHHTLSDFAGEGIGHRDIDVIGRNGECFDQQGLNQQAGDHLALLESSLKIAVKGFEELFGERQIGFNSKVATAGCEALHVLHLHPCQTLELLGLLGDQRSKGDVVVVGFLLALDHDGVDPAVSVLVGSSREIRQCVLALQHGCFRCIEGRHRTLSTTFSGTDNNQCPKSWGHMRPRFRTWA